jgi:hypothetical protein
MTPWRRVTQTFFKGLLTAGIKAEEKKQERV